MQKNEEVMSVIHAFLCNESNLVFKSRLTIYHQYIDNIEEDRIPTSSGKPPIKV